MVTGIEIEEYALNLVHAGAADYAHEDMNEDDELNETDWREARQLGKDMARAIREHQGEFLAWFRSVTS